MAYHRLSENPIVRCLYSLFVQQTLMRYNLPLAQNVHLVRFVPGMAL